MKERVMIVDDIAAIRLMLRYMVEKKHYIVVAEAANGAEAVEKYREHLPDITIMDIEMPYKTGVEAAREIFAHTSGARIVFCSGGVINDEVAFIGEGMTTRSFVQKPFLPAQLYQAMKL